MKYFGFKQETGYGFFNEPFEDAIPLSEDEWQNLLNEQSKGKLIVLYEGSVFATDPKLYYFDNNGQYQKRTIEELTEIEEINKVCNTTNTALNFLNDTDWKVTRHRDQQAQGIETSLSELDYQQLLKERQKARENVIRGEKYDINQ